MTVTMIITVLYVTPCSLAKFCRRGMVATFGRGQTGGRKFPQNLHNYKTTRERLVSHNSMIVVKLLIPESELRVCNRKFKR